MRPCGANYGNCCSSKLVASGGGRLGTCEEDCGGWGEQGAAGQRQDACPAHGCKKAHRCTCGQTSSFGRK
ncbi:hypothetical protein AAFF_G00327460 [Aldrovandia affinis]|uniref:Uncharacterized protein n=1 Tax=Aldrovandia affinis TaxID=143900 RepID=A0AAD7TAM0_9TELE|nr:hypothetical protein AAFF_G00327460 [Aldrovandia affinis]